MGMALASITICLNVADGRTSRSIELSIKKEQQTPIIESVGPIKNVTPTDHWPAERILCFCQTCREMSGLQSFLVGTKGEISTTASRLAKVKNDV